MSTIHQPLMSDDGACVSDKQCQMWAAAVNRGQLETLRYTVVSDWGETEHDFVRVDTPDGRRLAHIVTGTLYHPKTGRCSDSHLFIKEMA